jgi:PAS domain S-box-containing protein
VNAPARPNTLYNYRLFLVAFVGLAFLVVSWGASRITIYQSLKEDIESETLAADKAQVEMGAGYITDHQQSLAARMAAIASYPPFVEALAGRDVNGLVEVLARFTESPELESVFITDALGVEQLRLPTDAAELPEYYLGSEWFQKVNRTKAAYISDLISVSGRERVLVALPVTDSLGRSVGVLGAYQRHELWTEFFSRLAARSGRSFYILDRLGQVVAQDPRVRISDNLVKLAREMVWEVDKPGQAVGRLVLDHGTNRQIFMSAATVPVVGWYFVITHEYDPVMAPMQIMFRNLTLFLSLLFLCLMILGGLLFARYESQKKSLVEAGDEARRLEAEVQARTADLYRSTQRYRSLVEDLPEIIYELDETGRLTFVSNVAESVLGYTNEEMVGQAWRGYVAPGDRDKFDEEWIRAEQGQHIAILELRHVTKERRVRWLSLHARSLFTESGVLTGWHGAARDVTKEVMAEQQVRELSRQIIRAQEEERKRLSLDLHDEMGQLLSALKIGLQALMERHPLEDGTLPQELNKLTVLAQKIMDRMRNLAYNLRPAILDNFGLAAAIDDLCESVAETSGLYISFKPAELEESALSPEVKTTLFRFVQEGLTNAVRYSGTAVVEVALTQVESGLVVTVRDRGRGFNVDQALSWALIDKKLGLLGMMERLSLIGGRLNIESGPEGTELKAVVDL